MLNLTGWFLIGNNNLLPYLVRLFNSFMYVYVYSTLVTMLRDVSVTARR
jgi:hypothetical protein